MSKYTTDRNGIVVGWDNVFFYHTDEGCQDFKSILWCESYELEFYNGWNLDIRTPAQQLVYESVDNEERIFGIHSYAVNWLNKNTPGWGTPPLKHAGRRRERFPAIFFLKVSDARKFRKYIQGMLKGLPKVKVS